MTQTLILYEDLIDILRFQSAFEELYFVFDANYNIHLKSENHKSMAEEYLLAVKETCNSEDFVVLRDMLNYFGKSLDWADYSKPRLGIDEQKEVIWRY